MVTSMVEEENSSPLYVKKEGGGHVQYLEKEKKMMISKLPYSPSLFRRALNSRIFSNYSQLDSHKLSANYSLIVLKVVPT